MTADMAAPPTDDLPIYTSDMELPVCLVGDRLQFTVDCIVEVEWGGQVSRRIERCGDSWDGATIPRYCWSVIGHPFQKEFRWASYWHDRFCENSVCIEDRTVADAIFLRLLKAAGVSKKKRMAMWAAVRLYGILFWRGRE